MAHEHRNLYPQPSASTASTSGVSFTSKPDASARPRRRGHKHRPVLEGHGWAALDVDVIPPGTEEQVLGSEEGYDQGHFCVVECYGGHTIDEEDNNDGARRCGQRHTQKDQAAVGPEATCGLRAAADHARDHAETVEVEQSSNGGEAVGDQLVGQGRVVASDGVGERKRVEEEEDALKNACAADLGVHQRAGQHRQAHCEEAR
mmetsp:Transcript_22509/g.65441  ORF Transcript_22509/g.65441 Transcript_22509/m.65441 type:complete len:203 (-) Transcript_22509:198-806(-)|eukprot:CAMPEP_0118966096 /NCGR_PEP_ID=MMETSP1173-20130426/3608_1 /TAXON_ID=1034831 /ORGANISM="Rhizochromulina marina cf, Strain CCMP1243" /LENGTH=202 /DNA_ID=CAMNT_0006914829 /DNA_START=160 /DNA_END=768 /DNA_ORIENTATION=+